MPAGRDAATTIPPIAGLGSRPLPPLAWLMAFEALARHLSLARASSELRVSPAALAQSVAGLESHLGVKLLRRRAPTVELTAAGERHARAVQAFVHGLRDGLCAQLGVGRARLRVTAPQALARRWLAPRLADLARRHPRLDLVVTTTERVEPLGAGKVDVALRYGHVDDAAGAEGGDRVAVPLWTERLVAVGAPALAARADGRSPAEIVRDLPLIDHPAAGWRDWLAGVAPPRPEPRAWLACTDLHLAIEAARLGHGLVVAPSRLVADDLAAGRLRRASDREAAGRSYRALFGREQAQRAPLRAFVDWLVEQAASSS